MLAFVEIEEVLFIRHANELALVVVLPIVEGTEQAGGAAAAFLRHDDVGAMRANIVERADHIVFTAYDQQRSAAHREIAHKEITRLRDIADLTDIDPSPAKHPVAFELVKFRGDGFLAILSPLQSASIQQELLILATY